MKPLPFIDGAPEAACGSLDIMARALRLSERAEEPGLAVRSVVPG